ncbi:MAG: SDR family oxidoreductase [Casimicrobium sp.]|jgi:NAD(P)-dependent dehydrogenase (short-subunit alcohol dehydrogenase family)
MNRLSNIYPSLRGKHVFITGGATGIGAALVENFIAQGALVSFLDIDDAAANELKARLNAKERLRYWHCDIRDVEALQQAINQAAQALGGRLDVYIGNAANDVRHNFDELTTEFWDNNQSINLRPQVFGAQAAARLMTAAGNGGSIITTGSVSWMRRRTGMVSYTTSKAAIHGLTRTLAQELGPRGIRVNCVVPGAIVTPKQLAMVVTPELEKQFLDNQALKFRLDADDVVAMALWLASDDARGCAGQAFIVDGGIV